MEKGQGPALAVEFRLAVYPTLFFVDGNGTIVHTSEGYHSAEQLLAIGTQVMAAKK
jgi:thioredoxin-related protein